VELITVSEDGGVPRKLEIMSERQSSLILTSAEPDAIYSSPESFVNRPTARGGVDARVTTVNDESAGSSYLPTDKKYCDPRIRVKDVEYAAAKRFCDIVIAVAMLLITSPLLLISALLVQFTSKGGIIFGQERVGKGGRRFTCYKLRSMCADAEARKAGLMNSNEVSGPVFKMKNDPRVTPVGKWLRAFSIDELPQLWNVIRGEMSIVGPRPPIPAEVEKYTEFQLQRLSVQPGLTCLWQINGRSNVEFDRWVELDLLYIEQMTLKLDIEIVLKTIPAVAFSRGAH
jgi:lipopolysaccharide/colanic/teichoic acid biosynthesis glycosyltransferase